VRLNAFDLETEALAKIGPRHEIRGWLREWSGVSVYRDGFRIWPYGEPHDDWLRLDQRRVNNPVVRLSNNQVVGFVEIHRDANPDLMDQTNREGLIHNQAFEDLRKIIEFAFHQLEEVRQGVRHPVIKVGRSSQERAPIAVPVADAIENLARSGDQVTSRDLKKAAAQARDTFQRQEDATRQLIEAYNDLAAAGQIATGLVAALSDSFRAVMKGIERLARTAGGRSATDEVKSLTLLATQLRDLVQLLGRAGAAPGKNGRNVDIVEAVSDFNVAIHPLLRDHGATMTVTSEGDKLLRAGMHPESFRRVLHLLLSNSLDWSLRTDKPRVTIHSLAANEWCEVSFGDNGLGIARKHAARVFEPMFSLKDGGRGMGLTIARGLVEQAGGTLEAVIDGRRRGALFRIRLPRKRARTTTQT
jgi:signal transduction histidine kinase